MFTFQYQKGASGPVNPGKIVCVGRNYADHAKELGNEVPESPILFMKPATALAPMEQKIVIPGDRGSCHIETEMALLICENLSHSNSEDALSAIAAVGLAFDLTLRDLQSELKAKGHPWERAKAFDGSCPLSHWINCDNIDWDNIELTLERNGKLQQSGNTAQMINSVANLLSEISQVFTLIPGDIVLTGTPAGVCQLRDGDELVATLDNRLKVETKVEVISEG